MARSANERYHDRVAPRYDAQHEGDPYLSFCRELAWRHLKRHLPRQAGARVLDAGCGPGHYGLKLAKSGYRVDFLDLSPGMLDAARTNAEATRPALGYEPRFVRADLEHPEGLEEGVYALIVAQGDVLSFVANLDSTLRAVRRLLVPGGKIVASLDQRYAGLDHLLEGGDVKALERFLKDGRSEWLAKRREERFATRMYTAEEIRTACRRAALDVVSLIGRPVLPLSRHRALLEDAERRRRLLAIEERLQGEPDLLGRASHLEVAAAAV
jgi:SAM-dependent methyltransferase